MKYKIRTRRSHQQVIDDHVDEILDDLLYDREEVLDGFVSEHTDDWDYDIPVLEQAKRAKEQAQWMAHTRVHIS